MLKMRRVLAATVLLLCGLTPSARSATNAGPGSFIVDRWENNEKDGLPSSSIISMIQTRDGYLWLGTLSGLVRFDGVHFKVFDEANTPGLDSSRIVSLFEDSHSNLWIGTETAGVLLARGGVVTSLGIGQGGREGRLMSACEDGTGAVWLYTADGQLCRYKNGRIDVGRLGADFPSRCRVVAAEDSGLVWVGTDIGLFTLNASPTTQPGRLVPQQFQPMKVDFLLAGRNGGCWRLANGMVQLWRTNHLERDLGAYPWRAEAPPDAACEDADGNLIVGTLGDGVFWYQADGSVRHISVTQDPSRGFVTSLCVDREGSLWIGTDGSGLYRVRRTWFNTAAASRDRVAQSVCEDNQGGLWAGFNNGGAIYLKDGAAKTYGAAEGLLNPYVWSVLVDRHQRVWAGTWGGAFLLQDGEFQWAAGPAPLRSAVLAMYEDRTGKLWFGTQNGLVSRDENGWQVFTSTNGLTSDAVRAITDDANGNLWIGTMGGGLDRLHNGQITAFRKSTNGLPSDNISSLYVDAKDVLWIGTFGSGLARYHEGNWTRYTTRDGLTSNGIGYLLDDGLGNLWIGSNLGLMKVSKQELNAFARREITRISCRTYQEADGLPTRECTQGSQPGACRARDGTLWFPTTKGLVSVNPEELRPNTNPPPVVIESVQVDGQLQGQTGLRAPLPQTVIIPPHKESLEIQYTSLNLAAADRARFRYQMLNHEDKPVDAGSSRFVRYSKMPPGHYRFEVFACNEDGVWNRTGAALAIIVEPPFWQEWWFLITVTACFLGIIVATVYLVSTQKLHRQLKQQEALEKDRSRIARDLHDQLGASLTQIALLGDMVESDKDLPTDVESHGQQISQSARDTTRVLDEIVWTVNPSNDTLDSLVTYVCKYAQEYLEVAGLRYRLEVPNVLPSTPLKPEIRHNVFLAAKEAITNVVRHAQATSVWLRLRVQPDSFTLEIQDDGRGVSDPDRPSTRNGLRNMRKRMEDVGGSFSIGPAPERGTMVRLTAPFGKQSD